MLLFFFGAFGGLVLCVSLFDQLGQGWSPIHAGPALLPMVIGMLAGMAASFRLVTRPGRRLLHIGVLIVAAGTVVLAIGVGGADAATTLTLAPGLFLIGLGVGASVGQLFSFIISSVSMDEIGSASGILEAAQQLANALGVAPLGTVFLTSLGASLPTHALAVTAWACLVPIAAAFVLIFRLPMNVRKATD